MREDMKTAYLWKQRSLNLQHFWQDVGNPSLFKQQAYLTLPADNPILSFIKVIEWLKW